MSLKQDLDDWAFPLIGLGVPIGIAVVFLNPLVGIASFIGMAIAGLVCIAWPVDRMFGGKGGGTEGSGSG
jgi:hypothetical protein